MAKFAYPSLKGLSSWFADLVMRVEQLMAWTTALALLKSLWVAGFFNPMSFLTAVMQVNARTKLLPLDFMVNRCCFSNMYEMSEIQAQPSSGVYAHGFFMEGAGWEEGKGEDGVYHGREAQGSPSSDADLQCVCRAHRRDELGWNVRLPGLRHLGARRDLRLLGERADGAGRHGHSLDSRGRCAYAHR